MTTEGKWVESEIQTGWFVDRPARLSRVREYLHRITHGLVKKPTPRKFLHTSDGRVRPIHVIVPSAEGIRFYGSSLPLPATLKGSVGAESLGSDDRLAVDLTPGAGGIPPEGWPDDFRPEEANRILGYLDDEK